MGVIGVRRRRSIDFYTLRKDYVGHEGYLAGRVNSDRVDHRELGELSRGIVEPGGEWMRAWGAQGISGASVSVALIGARGGGPGEGDASATYSATAKGIGADAADDDGSGTRAGIFLRFAKQKPPNA